MPKNFFHSIVDNSTAIYTGFAALIALLVAIIIFVSHQIQHYEVSRDIVKERQIVYEIYIDLLDAETGQRGFLLTDNKAYLVPYNKGVDRIGADLKDLSDLKDTTNRERVEINALGELAEEKLKELRSTIQFEDANRHVEALATVDKGVGQTIMDQIRARIDRLVRLQQQRLDAELAVAQRDGNALRLGSPAAVLFTIAVGFLSIRRLRAQLAEIGSARDGLSAANTALLNEAAQRNKLADQLRQSQKMEAMGHLAGGLAHDLNNMLLVILNGVGLAKRALAREGGDPRRYLEAATVGVERAAALTHRLLAFSRQQPLSPQAIDPNKMVSAMAEMLVRTLGETVQLETVLASGLWRTQADAGELESAIVNLALNARDAMPEGGKLTIETSNAFLDEDYAARQIGIPAGQYVLIAVSDTGTGITRDVIEQAFDPFYTTKPPGQGTGLGLSQVYGFVRQSEGHVKIYSEAGQGTTVKIYLPRFYGAAETRETPPALSELSPRESLETILLVEDDDRVRRLTADTLIELGYRVLEADRAAAALGQLERNAQVDLLFTDVILPDKDGRKLGEEVSKLRPGLQNPVHDRLHAKRHCA